jgi:hypothetical protein
MDSQQAVNKPRNIILAVRLIYVTLAISILSFLFWSVFWLSGVLGEVQTAVCDFTLLLLVTLGMLYLASKISQGRKWARSLFTALAVLQILALMCSFFSVTTTNPTPRNAVFSSTDPYTLARILALLQTSQYLSNIVFSLIGVVAVFLLYKSDSNEYFAAVEQLKKRTNELKDGKDIGR